MKTNPMISVDTLHNTNLFREFDRATIQRLAIHCHVRELPGGDCIWHRGETPGHFAVVLDGFVAMQQFEASGTVVVVALFGPGETLCIAPVLQHVSLPADAVVFSDTAEVLVVPAPPVLDEISRNPHLAAAINRVLMDHATVLRSKIEIVSAGTVPRRMAQLLLWLADRFGQAAGNGAIKIYPALTREQIGQLVNARTETVIRIMSRWVKAGWIVGGAHALLLNRRDMLERIATSCEGTMQR